MEYLAGYSYRIAAALGYDEPFHIFVLLFISVCSSLIILPLFGLSVLLWRSRSAALATAVVSIALYPLHQRAIGLFLREIVGLPLLACGLWLLLAEFAQPTTDVIPTWRQWLFARWRLLLAASLLIAALAAWHFSSFFLMPLWLGIIVTIALGEANTRLEVGLATLLAAFIVAGALVPHLRESHFLLSPHLQLPLACLVVMRARRRWRLSPAPTLALLATLVVCLVLGAPALSAHQASYGHVYETIFAKARHFGLKPQDPTALSPTARLMWITPDNTLRLPDIVTELLPMLALVVPGLLSLRSRRDTTFIILGAYVASFAGLFLLIQRMQPQFFMCATPWLGWYFCGRGRRYSSAALTLVVAFFFVPSWITHPRVAPHFAALAAMAPAPRFPITDTSASGLDTFRWVRNHTPTNARILSTMQVGPMLVIYAQRQALLHSKVENAAIRQKYDDFLSSIFESEQALYEYCSKHGATHFLYQIDIALNASVDGLRYMSGRRSLFRDDFVYSLQFLPERLQHFRLVHQDGFFRLFEVVANQGAQALNAAAPAGRVATPVNDMQPSAPGQPALATTVSVANLPLPYFRVFDETSFTLRPDGALDDDTITRFADLQLGADVLLEKGINWYARGEKERGRKLMQKALDLAPDHYWGYAAAVDAEIKAGEPQQALQFFERALAAHPFDDRVLLAAIPLFERLKQIDRALECAERCLMFNPEAADCAVAKGRNLIRLNQLPEALALLHRWVADHPDNVFLQWFLGVAQERSGNSEAARACFTTVLRLDPNFTKARDKLRRFAGEQNAEGGGANVDGSAGEAPGRATKGSDGARWESRSD